MNKPAFQVTPKNRKDKKKAEIMTSIIDFEYNKIMRSNLKTPFLRAINAINMSYMLFGYLNPEYVLKKQNEFLKLYKESLNATKN